MITKQTGVPLQLLALLAGIVIDSVDHRSYRERMVPVKFESFDDEYDLCTFLWANVNREKRCSVCRKYFDYNVRYQHVFSVAFDAEYNIKFLHRSCAANSRTLDVIIEGSNYSDTLHRLNVPWRGLEERAVIGKTKPWDGLPDLLDTQERAQLTAEFTALKAEQQRRAQFRPIQ